REGLGRVGAQRCPVGWDRSVTIRGLLNLGSQPVTEIEGPQQVDHLPTLAQRIHWAIVQPGDRVEALQLERQVLAVEATDAQTVVELAAPVDLRHEGRDLDRVEA